MTDQTPVPGFLELVDAEIARLDALFAAFCHGAFMAQMAAAAAQSQRPTERSARATRAAAYRAGLPVIGGGR